MIFKIYRKVVLAPQNMQLRNALIFIAGLISCNAFPGNNILYIVQSIRFRFNFFFITKILNSLFSLDRHLEET